MNFGMEKGRLTKKVRRTINDVQRPPQPLDTFDCGNIYGFVRTSDSILQKRMDINTGVLHMFESQRTCVHGLDDQRRHREMCAREFESPRNTFEILLELVANYF